MASESAATRSFAVRKTWDQPTLFGREARTVTESLVVEAEDVAAAIRVVTSRSSVGSLEAGVLVEVEPISWGEASTRVTAKYDGPAMNENHTATSAKLVIADA